MSDDEERKRKEITGESELGDAPREIIAAAERMYPRVTEDTFKRETIYLLENLWVDEFALSRYRQYVGELTMPLNIVDMQGQILFTVPPILPPPRSTMVTGPDGLSVDQFMRTLDRDAELGGRQIPDKMVRFLSMVIPSTDYYNNVIVPVTQILNRYGRSLRALNHVQQQAAQTTPNTDGFSDDYEDD